MKTKYVAYYRVSTKQQAMSGLGLDAQQRTAIEFVKVRGGMLVEEFQEIESGKKETRLVLEKAITRCKVDGCILLVAKLDRLARNLNFLTRLMDSGLKFQCCDMPEVDNFTIHILGAVAQKEREAISERTKVALAEKKRRIATGNITNVKPGVDGRMEMKPDKHGVYRLGSPKGWTDEHRKKASEAIRQKATDNAQAKKIKMVIELCLKQEMNNREIADYLNSLGMETLRGKKFTRNNVKYLIDKVASILGTK